MTSAPDRYHALDALRGFAMLLGVLLHAAIPYVTISVPFWPVQDSRGHPAFDLFLFAVHDFRMQVFFLLAGFFGALLYARYGLGRTAWHRFKRIALPLVLGMATVQPATQAALIYAAASAYRDNPDGAAATTVFSPVIDAGGTPADAVVHHFVSGRFLDLLVPAHLWFLWYLVILLRDCLAAGVGRRPPARPRRGPRLRPVRPPDDPVAAGAGRYWQPPRGCFCCR